MRISTAALSSFVLLSKFAHAQYDAKTCFAHPDPHFKTWNNDYYDYHGGCDVVMITNSFLDLHIRTEVAGFYSKVAAAALQIGSDILEVTETDYKVNGFTPPTPPADIGGQAFLFTPGSFTNSYEVELNPAMSGYKVQITQYNNQLSVQVTAYETGFDTSQGLCGLWDTAGLFLRDGTTTSNGTELGEDWQVEDPGEPMLFSDPSPFNQSQCAPPCSSGFGFGGGNDDRGDGQEDRPPNGTPPPNDGNVRRLEQDNPNGDFGDLCQQFPEGPFRERDLQGPDPCSCVDGVQNNGLPQTPEEKAKAIENCQFDYETTKGCMYNAYYDGSEPVLAQLYTPASALVSDPCNGETCAKTQGTPVFECDRTKSTCTPTDDDIVDPPTPPSSGGKKSGKSSSGKKGGKKMRELTDGNGVIVPGCSCASPL